MANKHEPVTDFDYKVHVTKDYSIFKNLSANRLLKQRNINAMLVSMGQKQLIIPIVCTKNKEGALIVIDGQHRLYVCEYLELPVYYIVVPGYDLTDIQRANQVGVNWKIDDFIHMFIVEGVPDYVKMDELIQKYHISISSMIKILSKCTGVKQNILNEGIKSGKLDLSNSIMQITAFLEDLMMFKDFSAFNTASFVSAFLRLYFYEGYDNDKMHAQVERLGYKLEPRSSEREYIALLCNDIYAFQSKSCDFKYDKINNKFYKFK